MRAMARARRTVASSPAPPVVPAPLQRLVLQTHSFSVLVHPASTAPFVSLHFLLWLTAVKLL